MTYLIRKHKCLISFIDLSRHLFYESEGVYCLDKKFTYLKGDADLKLDHSIKINRLIWNIFFKHCTLVTLTRDSRRMSYEPIKN